LGHLKKWDNVKDADVEGANKMAKDLGLIGNDQKTSLELSDPPDNTQPTPWAWGLSLVIRKAAIQLGQKRKPTALMPWIFIPDSQAFHFIMAYDKAYKKTPVPTWTGFESTSPLYSEVIQMLVPKKYIRLIQNEFVSLDILYVQHNRDENPEKKSQVNDLKERIKYHYSVSAIWYKLRDYPWLKNYVKFGKAALTQLLNNYRLELKDAWVFGSAYVNRINAVKFWIEEQLKDNGK